MSNSLTDMKRVNIITYIEQNFSRTQATDLNCLIFLSMREQTTVAFQHEELGFDDIPLRIVNWCDEQDEDVLLELATRITASLLDDLLEIETQVLYYSLDEIAAAALSTKNAQSATAQVIEPQNQPTLLSDY
ncbi:hypothetical protein [Nostoc sp.]|uniref:hypothetical protein n=1 Tax=Nostoc sp. TaxID=1180 RepID=UPI002FF89B78